MRPYHHSFHQYQPGVFHKMDQEGLIYVTIGWCSNSLMTLGLVNSCTWWKIDSVIVFNVIYDIQGFLSLIYGELYKHHYLIFDQNANDNSYSSLLCHEFCNVAHKMLMMVIDLCYNTFTHLCAQHQHYPEQDTLHLSIFFLWFYFCISLMRETIFVVLLRHMLLEILKQTYVIVLGASVHLNMIIKLFETCFWTLDINWYIKHLLMAMSTSNTSLP